MIAACSKLMSSGIGTAWSAGKHRYSACAPKRRMPSTRVPTAGSFTPAPSSSTSPATSEPPMCGIVVSIGSPRRTQRSRWFSADARTPHQAVITAMDAAGKLGFSHLRISTVDAAPAKP